MSKHEYQLTEKQLKRHILEFEEDVCEALEMLTVAKMDIDLILHRISQQEYSELTTGIGSEVFTIIVPQLTLVQARFKALKKIQNRKGSEQSD